VPKVHFIGRVLPSAAIISVEIPNGKWKWQAAGLEPEFKVKIGHSFINIECEIEKYETDYFVELHKRASDLARAAVNVVAFASGLGLSVILETFIDPNGAPSAILPTDPAIPALCTSYSLDPSRGADLGAIYQFVLTEPPLYRALNDLIESITVPHVCTVNCGRVIDSIRRMITPNLSTPAGQAWGAMHRALNVSREYQEWISEQSKGPRHGDPSFVPGNIATEMTHRSWIIMNRYFEYRKRGNQPLPDAEFPILS
jgi:hypothetical protein